MNNWKQISEQEYKTVWKIFNDLFGFRPSVDKKDWPSIQTTLPQIKLDIKDCFTTDYQLNQLEDLAIKLFEIISNPGDRFYALNWQHECFDFDPRQEMDRDQYDEWIVPIFPNGDYYIFMTKDLSNVWFGHPWEKTITLIGNDIVSYGRLMIDKFKEIKITAHNLKNCSN